MEEYRKVFETIQGHWTKIQANCETNPSFFEPHVTDISIYDIEKMMSVMGQWFDRKKALAGTRPILDVVRAVLMTSLNRVSTNANTLVSGTYGKAQWVAFIDSLGQVFNAIQSAALFEEGDDKGNAQALYTALLESHAEVQRLMEKVEEYKSDVDDYQTDFNTASGNATEIEAKLKAGEAALQIIQTIEKNAESSYSNISQIETAFAEQKTLTDNLLDENEKLKTILQTNRDQMDTQLAEVKNIQENCDKLLKSATTAGLTLAFADRAEKVKHGKWGWSAGFIIALSGLIAVAQFLLLPDIQTAVVTGESIWSPIIRRLPLTLPFIWLAWFCAVQYGNSLRLQEDYEFKASTCKAFEGFHKHFEVLAQYPDGDSTSALKALAQNTIKTLSLEPGRKLGKCEKDVSFWTAFFQSRDKCSPSKDSQG